MSKDDGKFIDTSEATGWYELRDWLLRNGFKGDRENRAALRGVLDAMRPTKGANLLWKQLDKELETKPESFQGLEKA